MGAIKDDYLTVPWGDGKRVLNCAQARVSVFQLMLGLAIHSEAPPLLVTVQNTRAAMEG